MKQEGVNEMKYLSELLKINGHKLVTYDQCEEDHRYMTVFEYSVKYGGTYDSFKYYNNYLVDITR